MFICAITLKTEVFFSLSLNLLETNKKKPRANWWENKQQLVNERFGARARVRSLASNQLNVIKKNTMIVCIYIDWVTFCEMIHTRYVQRVNDGIDDASTREGQP